MFLVCIFLFGKVHAQRVEPIHLVGDTTYYEPSPLKTKKPHSAHKASLYSAILPGLGQAYNKKYVKIPILYAGIGALAYIIQFNSKYYNLYRSAHRDFVVGDPGNTSYKQFIPNGIDESEIYNDRYADWFENSLNNKKNLYRRNRDLTYLVMVGVYVIQIVDAAVDAHFYDFDISEDLSLNVQPALMLPAPGQFSGGVGMQFNFNF